MLAAQPSLKGEVSMLQIAVPSRNQIPTYRQLQPRSRDASSAR